MADWSQYAEPGTIATGSSPQQPAEDWSKFAEPGTLTKPKTVTPTNVSMTEALLPRATNAKSIAGKVGGGALDIIADFLKVPVAALGAVGSKVAPSDKPTINGTPSGMSFKDALQHLNKGEDYYGRPDMAARISASPATLPSIASGMGGEKLLAEAVPTLAKTALGKIVSAGASGVGQGLTSGLANEADSASQGKGFDISKAEKEGLETGAAGAFLGTAGQAAQKVGSKIVQAALKPGLSGEKEGFDVANVFKNGLGGTFKQMTTKVSDALKELRGQQDAAIAKNADVPISVSNVAKSLTGDLNDQLGSGKLFGDEDQVKSVLVKYAKSLDAHADADGNIPLSVAYAIKQKAAQDATNLYRARRISGNTDNMAKEKVSAMFSKKLNDAISEAAPEVTAMNQKFSEIIPIAKVLAHRNVIAGQNNPIGLDELVALDAGTQLATRGDAKGLLIPLLMRAFKMPSTGNALYKAGGKIQSPTGRTLAGLAIGANQ